ncbi:hypothetical protein ACFPH6_05065 [Streptomyces xiangluensis]|uniref:Uncharacterized protein n=1 Tax=Streptomyces xiangluensis TaxID=2665720 RepID=A0ABV8YHB5_9ACTN
MLTAINSVLSILDLIPDWTLPVLVLITGSYAWIIANRETTDPERKVQYVTAIAIVTGVLTYGLAVHQWPVLAGVDEKKPVAKADPVPLKKKPKLQVTSLREGQCIPHKVNVQGTGAIPSDTQIWVAHANDVEGGVPAETLMNVQRAKNIDGRPNLWQTGEFAIGDGRDSRSFWIYVYALPVEAGHAIAHQLYPDGFREKWPHWQNGLDAPIEGAKQLGVFKVNRSEQGC